MWETSWELKNKSLRQNVLPFTFVWSKEIEDFSFSRDIINLFEAKNT